MELTARKLLTLCDADTTPAICTALRERYYDNYSMVIMSATSTYCARRSSDPGR